MSHFHDCPVLDGLVDAAMEWHLRATQAGGDRRLAEAVDAEEHARGDLYVAIDQWLEHVARQEETS